MTQPRHHLLWEQGDPGSNPGTPTENAASAGQKGARENGGRTKQRGRKFPISLDLFSWTPPEDRCETWAGRKGSFGYGRVVDRGVDRAAHRVVYERAFGPIPPGMVVMHKCDNPPCVKLSHLRLGTHADNQHDKVAKGREAKGEKNGRALLTEADVRDIRRMVASGRYSRGQRFKGYREIGQMFGVHGDTVKAIAIGRIWKSVK